MTKTNQPSNATIWFVSAICLITFLVALSFSMTKENCWDKYTTEYEAITNCEGKN